MVRGGRRALVVVFCLGFWSSAPPLAGQEGRRSEQEYMVIVGKFRSGQTDEAVADLLRDGSDPLLEPVNRIVKRETTFVGGSTFKTEVPANVTQGIGFIRYIKSFQQPVFSEAEVDSFMHALQTGRRAPTLATHREHGQNLKRRNNPTAERQCPKCGSALLIRTVKSGPKAGQQFWGCSTFPKCRTMQSL